MEEKKSGVGAEERNEVISMCVSCDAEEKREKQTCTPKSGFCVSQLSLMI